MVSTPLFLRQNQQKQFVPGSANPNHAMATTMYPSVGKNQNLLSRSIEATSIVDP